MKNLVMGLALIFTSLIPTFARAEIASSFVNLNTVAKGRELGGAWLLGPFPKRGFLVGPRLALLWENEAETNRLDLQFGVENILWFANAVGLSLSLDWVARSFYGSESLPIQRSEGFHFRVDPTVLIRFLRLGSEGACAVRVGTSYDSIFAWRFVVGLSLQFTGVQQAFRE